MPSAIYKYDLDMKSAKPHGNGSIYKVTMPRSSRFLSMQAQHGAPQLWAIVSLDDKETQEFPFLVIGTGHAFADNLFAEWSYLGTALCLGGDLVLHVFTNQSGRIVR